MSSLECNRHMDYVICLLQNLLINDRYLQYIIYDKLLKDLKLSTVKSF